LSGSKLLVFIAFLSFLASCSVLQPKAPKPSVPKPEKPIEPKPVKEEPVEKVEVIVNKIMLLLPFQLDKIDGGAPSRSDVKRAEMPLDFYQGFKLALDNLAKEGRNFQLKVVDTRDDVNETNHIARSSDVQSADIIVGPIFPKEITAFAGAARLGYSLQISPLAASAPSIFNVSNLVSLSSPIDQHANGLADYLNKKFRKNDRVIIYNTEGDEGNKFLLPFAKRIKELNRGRVEIIEVSDLDGLNDIMTLTGRNYFVTALLNKFSVDGLLSRLVDLESSFGFDIQLVGHPNWAKSSFQATNLNQLNTIITSSYYVDSSSNKVRDFQRQYMEEYKMEPSEFAYKGFDTGYFFGSLLIKYGPEYPNALIKETYKGLQTNYKFEHNPKWGYVNTFIQILQFDGYQYLPIN
jgi:ABC-type branched-subunit amino acid transport system substrate-binding protein